ncbi:hypothetical protein DYB32_010422 [Aphanomyces invadans]|uniref:Myb-like DNA-binding protein n=1 Tax=Aphanomyces invadans TaxID=157072 RepID=A0A418AIE7_9STRA|nr:hypothetical protein DYB32_010422 [Aphanomyces invadans]
MADAAESSPPPAGSFGDVFNALITSLPPEASGSFFRCLSGLSAEESNMLSTYLLELKEEKKFRVIQALMDSPVAAKKRFIVSLREKFDRLKAQQAASGVTGDARLERSGSRQSSMKNITTEDIRSMGTMLDNAHIGESELRLKRLEEEKEDSGSSSVQVGAVKADGMINTSVPNSKRERPNSNWELLKGEATPAQRTREEGSSDEDQEDEDDEVEAENSPDPDGSTEVDPNEDAPTTKRWTKAQDAALKESVHIHGEKNWKAIAERVPGRNHAQCLQRWRKVLKPGLVKGHWSFEEDKMLEDLVKQSTNNWGQIAEQIPGRTPKQCRERWRNHLDPSINKGPYAEDEDALILANQARLGNKWSQIAQMLPGRTEDSVKIRWKSLKQNPTRAAAANAQSRRMNLHHHQQNVHTSQLHQSTNYGNTGLLDGHRHIQTSHNLSSTHQLHHTSHPQQHIGGRTDPMMANWAADYSDFNGSHTALLNAPYLGGYSSNDMADNVPSSGYTAHYPPAMHLQPPPAQMFQQLHHHQSSQHAVPGQYDELLMKSLTDELDFDEFGLI